MRKSKVKKPQTSGYSVKKIILFTIFIVFLLTIGYLVGRRTQKNSSTNQSVKINQTQKCTRDTPYDKPLEFERALSLINQRTHEAESSGFLKYSGEPILLRDWINCIDIQYANLDDIAGEGAEGAFIFDNTSSLDNLTIYVDDSYIKYDDILTSILIYHELSHVKSHIYQTQSGNRIPCFENEVNAFSGQLLYITGLLNDEERNSLYSRLDNVLKGSNLGNSRAFKTLSSLYEILNLNAKVIRDCGNNFENIELINKCINQLADSRLNSFVRENPGYQEQCR